jgi:hypothetical protein
MKKPTLIGLALFKINNDFQGVTSYVIIVRPAKFCKSRNIYSAQKRINSGCDKLYEIQVNSTQSILMGGLP